MKKIFLLLGCLIILSCDKDDVSVENNFKIASYYTGYMDFSFLNVGMPSTIINPASSGIVELEYDGNILVKKKGDYIYLGSIVNYFFSQDIIDEISYSKNKIIIEKKSYSFNINQVYNRLRTIELNNNGLMIKKTILELGASGSFNDIDTITIDYTYNSEKLLKSTHKEMQDASYLAYFPEINGVKYFEDVDYYYTNNNLDSIVTIRKNFDEQLKIYTNSKKIVETFSDYDESANPLKTLYLFDEIFKRSLSKNNYRTYTKDEYYYVNGLVTKTPYTSSGSNLNYNYDADGNIRFDLQPISGSVNNSN